MIKTISVRWLVLSTVFLWLTMGCAVSVTQIPAGPTPLAEAPDPQGSGWWFVRFKMDRPAEEIRWEKDLLIAHRVASPLIAAHEGVIDLWRFHRRSAEDKTGHQFSFLFFTTAGVADSINQVNDAINHIWQQEGYHALLHHLNAIYGYKALVYWEKRWKSF